MANQALTGERVVVTGAAGQLGKALRSALLAAGAVPVGLGARPAPGVDLVVDIADGDAVMTALAGSGATVVIHAAAYTDVDGCERDSARAHAVNADGSAHIAAAAKAIGAYLLAAGTDFVFPGDGGAPYAEDAPPRPISVYGASKLAGERAVLDTGPAFAVARTAWVYGGAGKHFPRTVLRVLRDRGQMDVVADEFGNPTYAADLAAALVTLAPHRPAGILHLVNEGRCSRHELAAAVAAAAGLDAGAVRPTTRAAFLAANPLPAARPADSSLLNTRAASLGVILRPWREAVAVYAPTLAAELGLKRSPDAPALSEGESTT